MLRQRHSEGVELIMNDDMSDIGSHSASAIFHFRVYCLSTS